MGFRFLKNIFQLKDLLKFLFIAVFVVFGIGIYYHANLWPDHRSFWDGNWQNWRVWTILTLPYWQLYGDPNLNSLDGKTHRIFSSNLFACLKKRSTHMF